LYSLDGNCHVDIPGIGNDFVNLLDKKLDDWVRDLAHNWGGIEMQFTLRSVTHINYWPDHDRLILPIWGEGGRRISLQLQGSKRVCNSRFTCEGLARRASRGADGELTPLCSPLPRRLASGERDTLQEVKPDDKRLKKPEDMFGHVQV
jgi:hypothetical protein